MTREAYIKKLIKEKNLTIKDFAKQVDIPYTTLLSMLSGFIGGASVDTVIKICKSLGITVDELGSYTEDSGALTKDLLRTSPNQTALLTQFNKLNDIGQEKAIEDVTNLTYVPKYTEKQPQQKPISFKEPETTESPEEETEDIQLIAYGGEGEIIKAPKHVVDRIVAEINLERRVAQSVAQGNLYRMAEKSVEDAKKKHK